jgi:hypothetical protein
MDAGATGGELHGEGGNDTISVGGDSLGNGGEGDDTLSIQTGALNTTLSGDAGNDILTISGDGEASGGAGDDVLTGADTSTLNGGAGLDTLTVSGLGVGSGGAGDDTLTLLNEDGGAGGTVNGGSGHDLITVHTGGQGNGDDGNDALVAEVAGSQVADDALTVLSGGAGTDTFTIHIDPDNTAAIPADTPAVSITDFDPTTEQLLVEIGNGDFISNIEIQPASGGSHTDVVLTYDLPTESDSSIATQTAIIRLDGVASLSLSQITLLVSEGEGVDASQLSLTPTTGTDGSDIQFASDGTYYMTGAGNDGLVANNVDFAAHLGDDDDSFAASGGSVVVVGGDGADTIDLVDGADIGTSAIYGGAGDDQISVARDEVAVYGGEGDNTFVATQASGENVSYTGGTGTDDITLTLGQTAHGSTGDGDSFTVNAYPDHLTRGAAEIVAFPPQTVTLNLPPEVTGTVSITTTDIDRDGTLVPIYEITAADGQVLMRIESVSGATGYGTGSSLLTINRDVSFS